MAILSAEIKGFEEVKQSNLQPCLLAKDAIRNQQGGTQAAIITVDKTGVHFGNAVLLTNGINFSLDEWQQIVDFVASQKPVEEASWEPDWEGIGTKYNYVAVDENGELWAYSHEPQLRTFLWKPDWRVEGSKWEQLHNQKSPNNLDWTQSLRKRPDV